MRKSREMLPRIVVTLCLGTFGLVVPFLELNATHVFNPYWPEHARLHEVWQLLTNCGFALLAAWLAWFRNKLALASCIGLIVVFGFLVSYGLQDLYGGSMRHTDGTELTIVGINSAVIVMAGSAAMLLGVLLWSRQNK